MSARPERQPLPVRAGPGQPFPERGRRHRSLLGGSDRAGFGLLTVVALTLVALGIGALAFLTFSSQAVGQAAWGAGGKVAEYAAEGLTAEVWWRLQRDVNDPASPVFGLLRTALLTGHPATLDLSRYYGDCHLTRDFLSRSAEAGLYRTVEFERPQVRVGVTGAAGGQELESQHVQIVATARAGAGGKLRRSCLEERFLGLTPVFPVKPFDQVTFAILEYDLLKTLPDIVAETLRLQQLYNAVPSRMAGWAAVVATNGCAPPCCTPLGCCGLSPSCCCCGCAGAHCHALPRNYSSGTWYYDRPQTTFAANLYLCERYAFPISWEPIPPRTLEDWLVVPSDSVVFSRARHVNLDEFNHERRLLETYYPRIQELEKAAADFNRLLDSGRGRNFCTETHLAWNQQMMAGGLRMRQALVKAIEALNEVLEHLHRHTRPGLVTGTYLSVLGAGRGRLRPLAIHLESREHLDRVLARHPSCSGHLAYHGPASLRLELTGFRGKAVLSCPPEGAELAVGPVSLDDPEFDRLVLWADNLRLEGASIEAAVFSNNRAQFAGEPCIRGNLILRHLRHRNQRGAAEDLRGVVEYDSRLRAGPLAFDSDDIARCSLGHFPIGLNPRLLAREMRR